MAADEIINHGILVEVVYFSASSRPLDAPVPVQSPFGYVAYPLSPEQVYAVLPAPESRRGLVDPDSFLVKACSRDVQYLGCFLFSHADVNH